LATPSREGGKPYGHSRKNRVIISISRPTVRTGKEKETSPAALSWPLCERGFPGYLCSFLRPMSDKGGRSPMRGGNRGGDGSRPRRTAPYSYKKVDGSVRQKGRKGDETQRGIRESWIFLRARAEKRGGSWSITLGQGGIANSPSNEREGRAICSLSTTTWPRTGNNTY